MPARELDALDLSCPCCAEAVERAVAAVPGVEKARVDYRRRRVTVEGDAGEGEILAAVRG